MHHFVVCAPPPLLISGDNRLGYLSRQGGSVVFDCVLSCMLPWSATTPEYIILIMMTWGWCARVVVGVVAVVNTRDNWHYYLYVPVCGILPQQCPSIKSEVGVSCAAESSKLLLIQVSCRPLHLKHTKKRKNSAGQIRVRYPYC